MATLNTNLLTHWAEPNGETISFFTQMVSDRVAKRESDRNCTAKISGKGMLS
ncbi:hypothetical protein JOY44_11680 [Phormidium sp. CLA17]|nr:hypothetical protein [Leptolyngbya sp. Cla-17]